MFWKRIAIEGLDGRQSFASVLHRHFPFRKLAVLSGKIQERYAHFTSVLHHGVFELNSLEVLTSKSKFMYICKLSEYEFLAMDLADADSHYPELAVDFTWPMGMDSRGYRIRGHTDTERMHPIIDASMKEYERVVWSPNSIISEDLLGKELWKRCTVELTLAAVHFTPNPPHGHYSGERFAKLPLEMAERLCIDLEKIAKARIAVPPGYSDKVIREAVQSYSQVLKELAGMRTKASKRDFRILACMFAS